MAGAPTATVIKRGAGAGAGVIAAIDAGVGGTAVAAADVRLGGPVSQGRLFGIVTVTATVTVTVTVTATVTVDARRVAHPRRASLRGGETHHPPHRPPLRPRAPLPPPSHPRASNFVLASSFFFLWRGLGI